VNETNSRFGNYRKKYLQNMAHFSPLKNLRPTTTFLHPITTQTPHIYHQKSPRFSPTPFKKASKYRQKAASTIP
jgi:hypothetical protein